MVKQINRKAARAKRQARVRAKISGTAARPRLNVFRSSKHIYAQLIDDVAGVTLASASSLEKGFAADGGNKDGAFEVGKGKKIKKKKRKKNHKRKNRKVKKKKRKKRKEKIQRKKQRTK
jgi:ribosomal protein L18